MEEMLLLLFNQVAALGYGWIAAVWCFACALFVALAPVKWTEKIPNFLMVIINFSAINWGNAANKLTNLKGNPVNGSFAKDT